MIYVFIFYIVLITQGFKHKKKTGAFNNKYDDFYKTGGKEKEKHHKEKDHGAEGGGSERGKFAVSAGAVGTL